MISIDSLTKTYSKQNGRKGEKAQFNAIKDVSFKINEGEILGIVGLSGSGKTTLLRCILQLTKPTEGRVIFENENIVEYNREELRQKVRPYLRKVYQHPEAALNPGLTIYKIIAQPITLYHSAIEKQQLKTEVKTLIRDVGLPDYYGTKYPHQLSGGEKRRVALARALASNPKVLFADEPFAGLDKALQYRMLKLLMKIKQERDLTIVMVSHDIDVISHVCDRIITLKDGCIADKAVAGKSGVKVNMEYFIQQ